MSRFSLPRFSRSLFRKAFDRRNRVREERSRRRLENRHLMVDPLEERQMLAVDASTSYDIAVAEHILGSEYMEPGQSIATDNSGNIVAVWQRWDTAGDTNIYARYLTDQTERLTLPAEIFEQGAGAKIKLKLYLPRETTTTGGSTNELTTSPAADEWNNTMRWEEISLAPITLSTASDSTYNAQAIQDGMAYDRGASISPIDFSLPAAGSNPYTGTVGYNENLVQVSVVPVTSYSSATGETTLTVNQFDITYGGALAKRDLTRLATDGSGQKMGALVVEWVMDARGQKWTLEDGTPGAVELTKVSSPEFRVNAPEPPDPVTGASTAVNQYSAAVAVDADGDFVITWTSAVPDSVTPGSVSDVYARRFSPQAYYANPSSLGADEQPMQSTDLYSSVVLSQRTDSDTAQFTISENSYLRVGDKVDVYWPSTMTEEKGVRQQMTVLNRQTTSAGTTVTLDGGYGADLPAAGTAAKLLGYEWVSGVRSLGNEFRVNTFTTNSQANSHVGMNDAGDFVIAWNDASQAQSFFNGVRAQRFNRDGQRVGNEWRVNREDTAAHINPYVAMTNDTMFAIVWETVRSSAYRAVNAEIYDFNAAAAPVTVDPTQGPNPLYSQFTVQAPATLMTGTGLNPTAAFDTLHPATGGYVAGYNLVIAWDEARIDPVAANTARNDVLAIQYRTDLAPAAGATTPTILRSVWRVNSSSFDPNVRSTWPLEQQNNQAVVDADGDLTVIYDGYGPDVYENNTATGELQGAANDVMFAQFDASTYTPESPYTGYYTTVLSCDNVANAYRDGQNQIYRLTLDGRTAGGTFVLTLESNDVSDGFLITGTEAVTVAVATSNMDTVFPYDTTTNIINRATTGTNIDTALQTMLRTGRNWTGTTHTTNSSILVQLNETEALKTAVNDSHLLNIYSATPSIKGNFTLRLDTVRDQRITATIPFDFEDLALPVTAGDITTRTQERMGEAIRQVMAALGWTDAIVNVQLLTTTTTPAYPYMAVTPAPTGSPPLQYQFLITFGGTGETGMAYKESVRHIYQDTVPTTFSLDAIQVTAAATTNEREVLSFYGNSNMNGPVDIQLGNDSEVQTISFGSEVVRVRFATAPSQGAFKLGVYDQVTGGTTYTDWLNANATAAEVQAALNANSAIRTYGGQVYVTEDPDRATRTDLNFYITFQGGMAEGDQPANYPGNVPWGSTARIQALWADATSLQPPVSPTITTLVEGTGRNEVQRIYLPYTTDTTQTWVISYDHDGVGTPNQTANLRYGATAAQVQSALIGLNDIVNGNPNGSVIVRRGGDGLSTSSRFYYDIVFVKGNGYRPIGNQTTGLRMLTPAYHWATATRGVDYQILSQGQVIGATQGRWTASFNGETSAALNFNATAYEVETALNALSTISGIGGSVSVVQGSTAHSYVVTFGGTLAMHDVSSLIVQSYTADPLVPNSVPAVVETVMGAQLATVQFDSTDLNGTALRIQNAIAAMRPGYNGVQVVRQTVPDTWPAPKPAYQFVVTFAGESEGINVPSKYPTDVVEEITPEPVTNWAAEKQTLRIAGLEGGKPWGLFTLSILDDRDKNHIQTLTTPDLFFDYNALPDTAAAIESALNQLLGYTGIDVTVQPATAGQTYYDFTINFLADAAAIDFQPVQVAEAPHPFSLTSETMQVSTSEVQYLNFYGAPTSVILKVGTYTTGAIAFTSTDLAGTATLMQTALKALGFDGVAVTVQSPVEPFPAGGAPAYQFRVEFAGKSTGKNLPNMSATVTGGTFELSPQVSKTQLLNFYGDLSSDFTFDINGSTVTYHVNDPTTTAQEIAAALGVGATVTHGTVPADYPYSYVNDTDAEPTEPEDQFRIVFSSVTRVLTDDAPYYDIDAPDGIRIKATAKDPTYGPRDGLPEIQEIQFYSPTPAEAQGYFTLYCGEEYLPSGVVRKIETSLIYFDVNDPLHTQWNIETALSNLTKYDGTRVGYDGVDVQYMSSTLSTPPVGSAGRYRVVFSGASSAVNIPSIEQGKVPVTFTFTSTENTKGFKEVQRLKFSGAGTMTGWFTLVVDGTETDQMYFDPSSIPAMQELIEDEVGEIIGQNTQELDFGSETDRISFTSTPMDGTWSITFSWDWNGNGLLTDAGETSTITFRYDANRYQIQDALNVAAAIKGPSATNPGYVYVTNGVDSSGNVLTNDFVFTFRGALANQSIGTGNFSLDKSHLHTILEDGTRPVVTLVGDQTHPERLVRGTPSAPTSTWTLTFKGMTTSNLAATATAADVQAALNALTTVSDLGGVTVTTSGTDANDYTITFNHQGEVGAMFTVNRVTGTYAMPYVMSDYVGVDVDIAPTTDATYEFFVTALPGYIVARNDLPLIEVGKLPVRFTDTQIVNGATTNEVQYLNFYGPVSGLFSLVIGNAVANDDGTWGTGTPMGIHFYATNLAYTAQLIEEALSRVANFEYNGVTVTSQAVTTPPSPPSLTPEYQFRITFTGRKAGEDVPTIAMGTAPIAFSVDSNSYTQGKLDAVYDISFIGESHDRQFTLTSSQSTFGVPIEEEAIITINTGEEGYFSLGLSGVGGKTPDIFFDPRNPWAAAASIESGLRGLLNPNPTFDRLYVKYIEGSTYRFRVTFGGTLSGSNQPDVQIRTPDHVYDRNNPLDDPNITQIGIANNQPQGTNTPLTNALAEIQTGWRGKSQAYASIGMEPDGDFAMSWVQYSNDLVNRSSLAAPEAVFVRRFNESTDTAGPRITDILSSTGDRVADSEQMNYSPNYLIITFDEQMMTDASAVGRVTNLDNWSLLLGGVTVSGGISHIEYGMNRARDLGVGPGSNKFEAVLFLDGDPTTFGAQALEDGNYQIVAKNSLRDRAGNPLGRTGWQIQGASWSRSFSIFGRTGTETLVNANPPSTSDYTNGNQPALPNEVQSSRQVATDADGDYVVVWTSDNPSKYGVFARVYTKQFDPATGDWKVDSTGKTVYQASDPIQVAGGLAYTYAYASVACDDDGDFVVTWSQLAKSDTNNYNWDVYYKRFDAAGNDLMPLHKALPVNAERADIQKYSTVAMDTEGDFVIAWQSLNQDGSGYGIYAQRFGPAGQTLGSTDEVQMLNFSNVPNGRFRVVWNGKVSSWYELGDNPARLDMAAVADLVTQAMEQLGAEVEVTYQVDPSVWVRFVDDSGGQDQPTIQIERAAISTPLRGHIGVVTEVEGNPGEFRVNDTTANNQTNPDIAMADDGSFVVTWTSSGQTGDQPYQTNVYAKRFSSSSIYASSRSAENYTATGTGLSDYADYVITTDAPTNHTVNPPSGYDGVVQVNQTGGGQLGSGVLLWTNTQILTAAHLFTDAQGRQIVNSVDIQFNTSAGVVTLTSTQIFIHPAYTGDGLLGGDLAIVNLPSVAPNNIQGYQLYTGTDELNKTFDLVGYGYGGQGGTPNNADSGIKRRGQNRYEMLGVGLKAPFGTSTSDVLVYDFDSGQAANDTLGVYFGLYNNGLGSAEASSTFGDSGGPSFINGRIAGIVMGGVTGLTTDAVPGTNASFGELAFDTRVSSYVSWIQQIAIGGGREFLVNTTTANDQKWSSVAMDADGDFVVTWTSYNQDGVGTGYGGGSNGQEGIYAQRYDKNGLKVRNEFLVNTFSDKQQQWSRVSMDADGDFVIAWESFEDRPQAPYTDGSGVDPDTPNSFGIYAQRFVGNAKLGQAFVGTEGQIGGETPISSTKNGNQRYPSVAADDGGNFVVVWCGNGTQAGNTDTQGVFSQRFQLPTDSSAPTVTSIYDVTAYDPAVYAEYNQGASATDIAKPSHSSLWPLWTPATLADSAGREDVLPQQIRENAVVQIYDATPTDKTDINPYGVTQFVVTFSEVLSEEGGQDGANSALNPSNWHLYRNDRELYDAVTSVVGIPASSSSGWSGSGKVAYKVTFDLMSDTDGSQPLDVGSYRLVLSPNVTDNPEDDATDGNALDGNYDGVAGGQFVRKFSIVTESEIPANPPGEPATDAYDVPLNSNLAGNQEQAAIARAPDGKYVVVWVSYGQNGDTATQGNIMCQAYDQEGNKVGTEFVVNNFTTGDQTEPDVAFAHGEIIVVWSGPGADDLNTGIYARRFTYASDGNPVAEDVQFRVSQYMLSLQNHPAVAMDADGNSVITWTGYQQDDDRDGVCMQAYDANGTPQWTDTASKPVDYRVNVTLTGSQNYPDVAMYSDSATGNVYALVVWNSDSQDGDGWGIYGRRIDITNKTGGAEFRINEYTLGNQIYPQVAMDLDGDAVVTWSSWGQDGGGYGVYARRYTAAGTPAAGEFRVNETTASNQYMPSVDMADNGNFVITWASLGEDYAWSMDYGIYCRLYKADGSEGYIDPSTGLNLGQFRVNATTQGNQVDPVVACDQYGNYIVVWTGSDGSGTGIMNREVNLVTKNKSVSTATLTGYYNSTNATPTILQDQLGITTPGLFDPKASVFYLRGDNSTGYADYTFGYGETNSGWIPVMGDWDGDGAETIGFYDPKTSLFYLRNSNTIGYADYTFGFGAPGLGWLPLVGDWNGDGVDNIGLFDPKTSLFYLRNSHSSGYADTCFGFGAPGAGWTPLMGDWDADGIDTLGLYDPSTSVFYLRNSNSFGYADSTFGYGAPNSGWTPMSGDWNSDGRDTIGFYMTESSTFVLRNTNSTGYADQTFGYGAPGAGWLPVVGQWDGPEFQHVQGGTVSAQATKVTDTQLPAIITEAISRWSDAGLESSTIDILANTKVKVVDLPGEQLGMAYEGTIYLDQDAAGRGWFVDPTPASDEEYLADNGQLQAVDPQALDRIDLLSVVSHELGHIAGLDDVDAALDEVMSATLSTSLRRTATADLTDAIFGEDSLDG
jgi:hypothetical protein